MATLKDVAKLAGVSVATASRVLNNNKNVSPENHQAIMQAMKTLNYSPNYLGRNLRMSSSKKILILLPTLTNQYYSRVVLGIEDVAKENDYNVIIGSTHGDYDVENNYINMLSTRLVDGIIFFSTMQSTNRLNEIAAMHPIVQCCEYKNGINSSRVSINNKVAAYDAVKHLLDCGHTKIALIAAGATHATSVERTEGYTKALAEAGIAFRSDYILHADYSTYRAMHACEHLMELPDPPTAIFSISDSMALGAMKKLSELGIRVCEDVAVIGFDNTSVTEYYSPSITTISQPRLEMGKTAMELLLKKLTDVNSPTEFITMPHQLIVRQSTVKGAPLVFSHT